MDFNQLQQAWDQQDTGASFDFDTAELDRQVARQQRRALRTTTCMELGYIGCMLALGGFAVIDGVANKQWYQFVPAALFVLLALYMLFDRKRRHALIHTSTESVKEDLQVAIQTLEHQIARQRRAWLWFGMPFVSVALWQAGFSAAGKPLWVYALAIAALAGLTWLMIKETEWKLIPQRDKLIALAHLLEERC